MNRYEARELITGIYKDNNEDKLGVLTYENYDQGTKSDTWSALTVIFGAEAPESLTQTTLTGVVIVRLFYTDNTGSRWKDTALDQLSKMFNYKTLNGSGSYLSFRAGTGDAPTKDSDYNQVNFTVSFTHTKEIE